MDANMNFRIKSRFLNSGDQLASVEMRNAAQQTLKDDSFSPLYVCYAAFIPISTCERLPGKGTDALRKISKSRRRPAAPKDPLALLCAPNL
jgi:hypothetical protein